MAEKNKRHSMTEALKDREEVRAFLEAGKNSSKEKTAPKETANRLVEKPKLEEQRRIAVTLRLPEEIAHALIDASAERRKNRKKNWSQQDIVEEALELHFQSRAL